MADDLPFNRLSVEYHFPNCAHCGAAGDHNVIRDANTDDPWRCLACGEAFSPHPSSEWHGVPDLPDPQRRDYVACEIREISPYEWASIAGVERDTISTNLKRARNALGRTRTEPREAPA